MQKQISFIEVIKKTIEEGDVVLPVFNSAAMKVQQELVKKEPDMRVLENAIATDQSLSSLVLQMANSSFYSGLVEVLSVRAAIVRLGIREVGRISLFVISKNQFRSEDKRLNFVMRKLWQHSVGCALGVNWLTKRCKLDDMESHAFFAGLLHDVGKLLVLMVVEQLRKKDPELPVTDALLMEAMESLHTKQGYYLMKLWNMPELYCVVTRDHHKDDYDNTNDMLILVRIANMMCNKVGIGLRKDPTLMVSALEEAHHFNLTEIDLAEMEIFLEDTTILTR
ncbi:MAG: HDOD domain-containing protein [Proteobacteria bacterium]|nr:HDOD domain-containing protein [Pseudomonadota bacterium]MBU1231343.1 HDOD domain-containing protein [Pseudomonadota bacterium]MBU1420387.1 HDOD domain-containing protein [Pseudomonadota bacterium]MBU1454397.1 HDOD domain-containing protein [Pseudomonadota bacterium]